MSRDDRALPRSPEAERAVLGGLMLDPEQIPAIAERLSPEDFHRDAHQRLFCLMLEMSEKGKPAEMLAVVDEINRRGTAEDVGGIAYVSALPDNVPSTENLAYYAGIVRERALSRRLIEVATQARERALGGTGTPGEHIEAMQEALAGLQAGQTIEEGWIPLSDVMGSEVVRIQAASERQGQMTGISTGLTALDNILCGLHPADLVVIGGRAAMGKTAAGLCIARNVAGAGYGVGIFSLEMSRGQLGTRLLCAEARVESSKIRRGTLSGDDWPKLLRAAQELSGLPIYIDDTPGLTAQQIRSKAQRLKAAHPSLAVLLVDYIGLMGGTGTNREQAVAAASRALKGIAKEFGITVICLAQLNRGVEARGDKRPALSDLRESGQIEQDADVIVLLYRDEYYNKESTQQGEATLIVAKHRQGAVGDVQVAFKGEYTLFENLVKVGQWDRYGGGL